MAKIQKKKCLDCGKSKSLTEFYMSRSNFSKDNHVDYCKACLTKNLNCEEIETVLNVLRIMDYPFIEEEWNSTFEKYGKDTTFGNYLRKVGLKQWKDKHYSDSIFLSDKEKKVSNIEENIENKNKEKSKELVDLETFWGVGHSENELILFQKKYDLLADDYGANRSSLHQESLQTYCVLKTKYEIALANGDIKEAKELGGLYEKAAQSAKITPKQLTASDLQDGLTTFSQLSLLVEENKDAISILPKMKEKPADKADFILFCYINYIRLLKGLPKAEYSDIWKFYEDRVNEYKDLDFLSDFEEEDEDEEFEGCEVT